MGLLLYCFQIGLIKKDIHYLLSECFRIKGNKISVFCVYAYRFCFNYCFDVICWAATNTAIRLNTVFFLFFFFCLWFLSFATMFNDFEGHFWSILLLLLLSYSNCCSTIHIYMCCNYAPAYLDFFFCSTQCAANEFTAIEQFYLAIELKCQRRRWTQIEYCPIEHFPSPSSR